MRRNNQLRGGVILSYINLFFNACIQLVYGPILIRMLGQSEYGLYTLVGSVINYLTLFGFGLNGAYIRFYSRYESQRDKKKLSEMNGMYFTIFVVLGFIAFICGLCLSLAPATVFGNKLTSAELDRARVLLIILSMNLFFTFPNAVYNSIITAHERFVFQRIVSLMGFIFNPLLGIICLFAGYKSIAICVVTTIVTLAKVITNCIYVKRIVRAKFIFGIFDVPLIKEMSAFSFFIFLNMIIDQINWSTDNYILGRIKGTGEVAVYGVGATINTIYLSISSAISSVFIPRVNRIANTENGEQRDTSFTNLFIRVGRVQFIVLGLVITGFTLFGEYFITHIYASAEYKNSYYVALLLIWPVSIPLIQNLGVEIQRSVNKHQARSIIYLIMAVANVLLSIPLSMRYGSVGAAFGTTISILIANGIVMNVYYFKVIKIDIPMFWRNITKMSISVCVPVVLGMLIKRLMYGNNGVFIVDILIYSIIYCISVYLFGLNKEEKAEVNRIALKMLKKEKPHGRNM